MLRLNEVGVGGEALRLLFAPTSQLGWAWPAERLWSVLDQSQAILRSVGKVISLWCPNRLEFGLMLTLCLTPEWL